jgi:hypothetical protein
MVIRAEIDKKPAVQSLKVVFLEILAMFLQKSIELYDLLPSVKQEICT